MTSTTSNSTKYMPKSPNYIIDVSIDDKLWNKSIHNVEAMTQNIITKVIDYEGLPAKSLEVSILLTNDDQIQKLNKNYRHKDKATNVLSFPQTEAENIGAPLLMLGDIVVAHNTINREAEEQKKTFIDHYTHMLVHGCLHLLNYDHVNEEDARTMESTEKKILKGLNIKNPYSNQ